MTRRIPIFLASSFGILGLIAVLGLAIVSVSAAVDAPSGEESMVAYWPLDDPPGSTTFDDVQGTNEGTCSGAACPSYNAFGRVNGSYYFDGGDEIIVPPSPSLDWGSEEQYTIELWVRTVQDCTGRYVMLGRYLAFGSLAWWVGCDDDNTAGFTLRDTNNEEVKISSTRVINDNIWHHIVAIYDGVNDQMRLYVDAVLEASAAKTFTGDFAGDVPVTFGFHNVNPQYRFVGVLDEVALYRGALTEAEILAHYNSGLGRPYGNLPPNVTNPGNRTNSPGDSVSLQIQASDPESNTMTFSASGLPGGLSINPAMGLINGVIDAGASTGSPYSIVVTVTDNGSPARSSTINFQWIVLGPGNGSPPPDGAGPRILLPFILPGQ